jgi:hypothetical protein
MKNNKYSVYKNGLKVGDLVEYRYYIFGKDKGIGYLLSSIVLERKHLFNKDTRWGPKGFFEYKMMNINSNKDDGKFMKIKTQQITIKKVNSAN